MTITTTEAIELRQKLEADIQALIVEFQRATELPVTELRIDTVDYRSEGVRKRAIAGVVVTVEV